MLVIFIFAMVSLQMFLIVRLPHESDTATLAVKSRVFLGATVPSMLLQKGFADESSFTILAGTGKITNPIGMHGLLVLHQSRECTRNLSA